MNSRYAKSRVGNSVNTEVKCTFHSYYI